MKPKRWTIFLENFQKVAPSPPVYVPETIELKGTSTLDDIPSSRSEWSDSFPSVAQRRLSFNSPSSSQNSSHSSRKTKSIAPQPPTTQSPAPQPPITQSPAPQPPTTQSPAPQQFTTQPPTSPPPTTQPPASQKSAFEPSVQESLSPQTFAPQSHSSPISNSSPKGDPNTPKSNSDSKRNTKKVVRRTISYKKYVTPPTASFDGPPEDGFDYIKICGRWVKMKTSKSDKPVDDNSNSIKSSNSSVEGEMEESQIPQSRGEWGSEVSVGK